MFFRSVAPFIPLSSSVTFKFVLVAANSSTTAFAIAKTFGFFPVQYFSAFFEDFAITSASAAICLSKFAFFWLTLSGKKLAESSFLWDFIQGMK